MYESNSGTAYQTYEEAVKLENSVRLQDVKDYLNNRDEIQVTTKPKTFNRFASPGAKYGFEIDVMDMESSCH